MVTADDIAAAGAKSIGVSSDGSIDIHGKQFHPTWTRLAHPGVGEKDQVNWEVGQSIVISTTSFNDLEEFGAPARTPPHQNEVFQIKAISGRKIQLSGLLVYIKLKLVY